MRCGLIGEKLGHSHSKTLHGLLADYRYDLIELAPEELGSFLKKGEFDGLNVTIPYKQAVIPYLRELKPHGAGHRQRQTPSCAGRTAASLATTPTPTALA